ncbi:MAG: trypsin-like peptidase domain-containing protein [Gammaproteobacteria bacterium SHHR-1]|uniref:trypsin-like peptidase domain-containing protein n=1 Tax=Magnetovirga frankeli TaxID=947516 RepID=UPI0012931E22|nr:trypsin-like peptidase domain-containing protein [gamma proteobacterium SS-5]
MKFTLGPRFVLKSSLAGLALTLIVLLLHSQLLAQPSAPARAPASAPLSYADAVERALPSVVNIYIAKVRVQPGLSLFNDPLFQHFFGDQLRIEPRQRLETSLGSGVVVRDGYILTNHHVIEGANRIQVATASGRTLDAEVIGTDPDTDLALLRAERKDLPAIGIADINRIRIGDVVLAIGNPFGVGQTVTQGIISATGRNKLGINTYENFIQTDAAINPGNSGGALIDAQGRLVGINTVIFSKSGGSQGIGFAIPADLAMGVMEQIIQYGRVRRGWLGLSGQEMTAELAETFDLKNIKGVLVTAVMRNGPADQAGLAPGDIITQFNAKEVRDTLLLTQLIADTQPGTQVSIQGWRGKHRFRFKAKMQERPKQRQRLN